MQLVLFQKNDSELLRWLVTGAPCRDAVMAALMSRDLPHTAATGIVVPRNWIDPCTHDRSSAVCYGYDADAWRLPADVCRQKHETVFVSCGRTAFQINRQRLHELLKTSDADVLAITVDPELSAFSEVVRLTSDHHVVGFRRHYESSVEPGLPVPQWPTLTCFQNSSWQSIVKNGSLKINFTDQLNELSSQRLKIGHFRVGGHVSRLDSDAEILHFFRERMPRNEGHVQRKDTKNGFTITGPVWLGSNVTIEPEATIIGPAVIADGVTVGSGAVIRESVVGPQVSIPPGQVVNKSIRFSNGPKETPFETNVFDVVRLNRSDNPEEQDKFRHWPFFSYPHFLKRIFDVLISAFVLILLLPLFPVFILLVKWKSPGPIFYRARRQGLHGREFGCLKFRTMILQAEDLQQQLRALNQVDGPQFKMDNDPRVSAAGKFLRDTCIDELPQFINVLRGQMSIVGPRPSPENENETRPMWRDARLSVRPGITGPWQVFRTRQPSMDFQEWVYYDTRYVRNMSFWQDVYICLKTAQKLTNNLLNQFG